jgi:hypothetical protein
MSVGLSYDRITSVIHIHTTLEQNYLCLLFSLKNSQMTSFIKVA